MIESEESITEEMRKDGWKKQFVTNEPRLSEAVALYKEAGFEVALRDMPQTKDLAKGADCGIGKDCRACFEGSGHLYKIIFTRPAKSRIEGQEKDLF